MIHAHVTFDFSQLFGEPDDEDEVSPDLTDEENLSSPSINNDEKSGNAALIMEQSDNGSPFTHGDNDGIFNRINTRKWAAENDYDPKILFRKVCLPINFLKDS